MIGKRGLSFGVCIGCCFRGCYRFSVEAVQASGERRFLRPLTGKFNGHVNDGNSACWLAVSGGVDRRRPRSFALLRRASRLESALSNLRARETFIPTWYTLGGGRGASELRRRVRMATLVLRRSQSC